MNEPMSRPTRKEMAIVQLMLAISLVLGVLPPLVMYFVTRKSTSYYREASHKALNFHLTIFPLFVASYALPSLYKYILLMIETIIILYAMIHIARNKAYRYPAIPYIKKQTESRRAYHDWHVDNRTVGGTNRNHDSNA
ncbi:DUF4870 domain-containing protein [Paenibacillus alvei]|nr:DUF4870 domain-containing protein [Paenibacillus alvei]